MKIITKRLMDSAKDQNDPRLNCMREFFGTLDGSTVSGWDTYYGKSASSDDSHLWHVHMSILRKYANDKTALGKILAVILGETDVVTTDEIKAIATAVRKELDFAAPADSWAVQQGYFKAGDVISQRTVNRQVWAYGKDTYAQMRVLTAQVAALTAAVSAVAADRGTSPEDVKAAAEAGARAALADLDYTIHLDANELSMWLNCCRCSAPVADWGSSRSSSCTRWPRTVWTVHSRSSGSPRPTNAPTMLRSGAAPRWPSWRMPARRGMPRRSVRLRSAGRSPGSARRFTASAPRSPGSVAPSRVMAHEW